MHSTTQKEIKNIIAGVIITYAYPCRPQDLNFFFLKQRKYRNNVMGFEIFFPSLHFTMCLILLEHGFDVPTAYNVNQNKHVKIHQ